MLIERIIYTIHVFSQKRKLGNDYLLSGGGTFFLLWMNFLTLLALICWMIQKDFFSVFVKYEIVILPLTLVGFIGFQFYAKKVVRKYNNLPIKFKNVDSNGVLAYYVISVLLLLGVLYLNSKMYSE